MEFTIKKDSTILLYIIFFILFIFSAFRDGLGTDYVNYVWAFENPEMWDQEYLFKLLFLTIPGIITDNVLIFFILSSLIINYYFIKSIRKYSPIILLSVIIYFTQLYFSSYNVVRQFIVLAIFSYYGFKYITEKRLISYIILVIILAQIHYSMYILLFFPIIGYYNRSIKTYWYIFSFSIVLFALQSNNILNFASIFNLIPNLSSISIKFEILQDSADFFFGQFQSSNQLIIKNLIGALILLRLKYFEEENEMFWFKLFLFSTALHNILVKFSMMAVRLSYIGDLALVMLVPFYINTFKDKRIRIALIVFFIIYFTLLFYYRFVLSGESEVFKQGIVDEQ